MHQKNIIFFLKFFNPKIIYVVLQIIQLKLLKLFLQSIIQNTNLNYCFFDQKLILFSENIGDFYFLSFFNFFDFNELFFQFKKKKQIINKIGLFQTDILEEKLLQKEESKLKTYKKSKRKYTLKKDNFIPYLGFNFLENFSKSKNFLYEKFFLSNNVITSDFFFNFLFNYFKNFKCLLFNDLFFLKFSNFLILIVICNSIKLKLRLYYFFMILCLQYIK